MNSGIFCVCFTRKLTSAFKHQLRWWLCGVRDVMWPLYHRQLVVKAGVWVARTDWFIHRKGLEVLREQGPVKPPFPPFLLYFSSICTIKACFQRRRPEQKSSGSWDMDDPKYVFYLFWRILPNEWRGFKALGDLKVGTSAPQQIFIAERQLNIK